jgi:hypothetical protein
MLDYKYDLMVDESEMYMLSEIYSLFHHNQMSFLVKYYTFYLSLRGWNNFNAMEFARK